MGKGMKSLVTENHETDQINNPTVSLGTRMYSVTSRPFQPNKSNIVCMDSNETCTCCGKELLSDRCLRCGACERCGT